jgi:hypothetical protein
MFGCLLFVSCLAQAQDFEGRFVQRIITVGSDDLYEILGEAIYAEDPSDIPALLMELDVQELATLASAEVEAFRILVRGDLTRVEPESPGDAPGYQIIDSGTGAIWMVNVPERSYVEFTKESAEEMEARAKEMMERMGVDPDAMDIPDEYSVEAGETESTGRTAEINGYRATAHTYTDDERAEVAWCADDDNDFFAAMKRRAEEGAFTDEDDEDLIGIECPAETFAVRTLSFDIYGQELSVDDLIGVKAESLPANLFEVPSGFTRRDIPGGLFGR